MQTTQVHHPLSAKLAAFALAALAAASAVYWGLKGWGPQAPSTIAVVAQAPPATPNPQALARAFGGGLAPALAAQGAAGAVEGRYALLGVVAAGQSAGSALISVQGQEARPVRVGQPVDDAFMLQSVTQRSAVLAPLGGGSQKFTLELPALDD
ncbi:MAG: type II secretion system protein N [Polaromonas sp.]